MICFSPSFCLRETGSVSKSPSVPSKCLQTQWGASATSLDWECSGGCSFCIEICLFIHCIKDLNPLCGFKVLLGSWIMILLFAIHALSILTPVESLVMSLIGKIIPSMSISSVQKIRLIPCSFRVSVPRVRSNPGWLIVVPSYSTISWCPKYSWLAEQSQIYSEFASSMHMEGPI